jgi:hypothetical protein
MNKKAITKHDIYQELSGFSEEDLYDMNPDSLNACAKQK